LVGKHVPPMNRFPGPIRIIARLLGGGFLYIMRMITNPQREFNHAIVVALRALQDGTRQMEKAHQQALDDLKDRQLEEIRQALQRQQRRLDSLLDEAHRKAS
jgi:cobalamin biosynthesis protein CobD/CbiB